MKFKSIKGINWYRLNPLNWKKIIKSDLEYMHMDEKIFFVLDKKGNFELDKYGNKIKNLLGYGLLKPNGTKDEPTKITKLAIKWLGEERLNRNFRV